MLGPHGPWTPGIAESVWE